MFLIEATEEDLSHRGHRVHRGREVREERKRWLYFFRFQAEKIKPTFLSVFSVSSVRKNPAFTLIELMIVMVVISILVGITIPVSKYVTLRARQASQKIYIEKIKSALEDYRAAYGEYPITPPNEGAARHYPENFSTTTFDTNSPYENVQFTTDTVESFTNVDRLGRQIISTIDYCLTYPLMFKQLDKGARPFMDFKKVIVAFLVTRETGDLTDSDIKEVTFYTKTRGGNVIPILKRGLYGNPVNRYEAIDPVSQRQWKYSSDNGLTYRLATNSF